MPPRAQRIAVDGTGAPAPCPTPDEARAAARGPDGLDRERVGEFRPEGLGRDAGGDDAERCAESGEEQRIVARGDREGDELGPVAELGEKKAQGGSGGCGTL